ncbi:hypothetical protein HG530_001692 [Fusarium avenaceum]|nr:hypothetical protein HG530_001692 [Fusarium avenaceum]
MLAPCQCLECFPPCNVSEDKSLEYIRTVDEMRSRFKYKGKSLGRNTRIRYSKRIDQPMGQTQGYLAFPQLPFGIPPKLEMGRNIPRVIDVCTGTLQPVGMALNSKQRILFEEGCQAQHVARWGTDRWQILIQNEAPNVSTLVGTNPAL